MVGQPKDLAQLQSPVQDVVFERYRVTYIRADGRNTPGVDVPFPWDGVANFRVPVDGNAVTRGFMIVRHQAKLEAPLAQLAGLGGACLGFLKYNFEPARIYMGDTGSMFLGLLLGALAMDIAYTRNVEAVVTKGRLLEGAELDGLGR